MRVTETIEGTYMVHEEGQRPVEGVAVYVYRWGWQCEKRCASKGSTLGDCVHIKKAKEAKWNK